jgi:hypothetical protein
VPAEIEQAVLDIVKVYLQTAIDCHSRYAWAKLYSSNPRSPPCI